MHGVNLDLLRAVAAHHPDGQPKDPHAHHRMVHLTELRATRHARWRAALAKFSGYLRAGSVQVHPAKAKTSCP